MENIEQNSNLVELRGRRDYLLEKYAKMGDKGVTAMNADEVKDFQIENKELTDLGARIGDLSKMDAELKLAQKQWAERNTVTSGYGHSDSAATPSQELQIKTLGEIFTESGAYKAYRNHEMSYKNIIVPMDAAWSRSGQYIETKSETGKLEYKDFESTIEHKVMGINNSLSGFVPKNVRSDTVINGPLQRPMVADIIPSYTTTNNITKWMKETTTTNNAAGAAEGAAPSESVLVWTESTAQLEKVASFISVTQEQLDDVPNLQNLIDTRLRYMHEVKEDSELLNGNASTPRIIGLNAAAMTGEQTQALGGDAVFDAFMKAIVKVQTGANSLGLADPTNIVMNPSNWQTIALTTTADGIYIYGNPNATSMTSPSMWGRPVCLTTNQTANTAFVGDFQQGVRLARRQEVTLDMSDSHSTNFTINVIVIKTTSRLALEHYIPSAFCFVTGLS